MILGEGTDLVDIDVNIYCERESHKGMVIGKGGAMLKKIAQSRTEGTSLQNAARKMVKERIFAPKVHAGLSRLLEGLERMASMKPADAIRMVLDEFGYTDYLGETCKTREELDSRKENIDEMVFNASFKDTLADYL